MRSVWQRRLGGNPPFAAEQFSYPVGIQISSFPLFIGFDNNSGSIEWCDVYVKTLHIRKDKISEKGEQTSIPIFPPVLRSHCFCYLVVFMVIIRTASFPYRIHLVKARRGTCQISRLFTFTQCTQHFSLVFRVVQGTVQPFWYRRRHRSRMRGKDNISKRRNDGPRSHSRDLLYMVIQYEIT